MIHYGGEWPEDSNFISHTFIEFGFKKHCTTCKVTVTSRASGGVISWYYTSRAEFKVQIDNDKQIPTCKQIIAVNNMTEALE